MFVDNRNSTSPTTPKFLNDKRENVNSGRSDQKNYFDRVSGSAGLAFDRYNGRTARTLVVCPLRRQTFATFVQYLRASCCSQIESNPIQTFFRSFARCPFDHYTSAHQSPSLFFLMSRPSSSWIHIKLSTKFVASPCSCSVIFDCGSGFQVCQFVLFERSFRRVLFATCLTSAVEAGIDQNFEPTSLQQLASCG